MGQLAARADPGQGTGRWTRAGIGLQVLLLVALAGGAAALVTWLAGRPGLHRRLDLTATGRNTLDAALAGILEDLPEEAVVEVFFRPLPEPVRAAAAEAQARMSELLFVAHNQFPTRLRVVEHDLSDVTRAAQRLAELEVEDDNVVVVSCGERRVVLRLLLDLARLDLGDVRMQVPPRLESFLGDQALGEALLDVSQGARPRLYFAHGHGERDPYDADTGGLNELRAALSADGFDVAWWEPQESPRVPEDCDVLAIVDPRIAYAGEFVEAVRTFVEGGGRLFVAPSRSDELARQPGSTTRILHDLGIEVAEGIVAQFKPDALGNFLDGSRECALLFVPPEGLSTRHPATEPLQRLGYGLRGLPNARAFERGTPPPSSIVEALARTTGETWRDLPSAGGLYDWRYDQARERPGPHNIVMSVEFPPPGLPSVGPDPEGAPRERPRSRVLAFGSADALGNGVFGNFRDLVLNGFNWLAERDWRLNVRPRDPDRRSLDLDTTRALAVVQRVAFLGLPGLTALIGIVLALRRRR